LDQGFSQPDGHMIAALRTFVFTFAFYCGSILFATLAFIGSRTSPTLLQFAVRGWSLYHLECARLLLGVKTVLENKQPDRPVLYAFKHESMFETIDMLRLFANPSVVAKKELHRIPLWGSAADRHGMIWVDRDGGAAALRAMLTKGKSMVAQGRPIVICPEGTRVPHGEQPALQAGFAGLYKMLGVPVIPVAHNSGVLFQKGVWRRKAGTITYRFGAEIPAGLPRAEMEKRVHAAINALND
jgi:1-acyl-sn-glycerol-3-phosphate acyltransferase